MLRTSVPMAMRLLPRSWILHPSLPLAGPFGQLIPVRTPMFSPKSRDASFGLVFDLHCRVGLTHQAVPEQINAVPYMAWRGHEREIVGDKLSAFDGGVMNGPVTPPNSILRSR